MKKALHVAVCRSYFWNFSVHDLALGFSHFYGVKVTVPEIEEVWAIEAQTNPFFCQARPATGFPSSDKIKLAERLAA